jgi:hypothetical protein
MFKGALGQLVALVAIALIAAVGLCLLDSDDAVGGDLCLSFLATAVGLFPTLLLSLMGYPLPALAKAYHRYPPDLPAPPPKASPLFA